MTAEQKSEIIRLRIIGHTQKEVSILTGFSLRTIKRIDKEYAERDDEESDLEDDIFEDEEEEWVMRYNKSLGASTPDSRSWNFIVYDDSAPKDWREKLIALTSPHMLFLHDDDVWLRDSKDGKYKKGEEKKHHWHGNLKFPKKISLKRACMIIQQITHGPVPKVCDDEVGLIQYVQHRHRDGTPIKGKKLYDVDRMIIVNGWEPERGEQDMKRMMVRLENYLIGLTTNYSVAVKLVNQNLGDEYSTLMRINSYHCRSIVEANRWLAKEDKLLLEKMTEEETMLDAEAEQHWKLQQIDQDVEKQEELTL